MPIKASCHCGATRFEVSEAPTTLTECNCTFASSAACCGLIIRPSRSVLLKTTVQLSIPATNLPTSIIIVVSAGVVLTTRCAARGAKTDPISLAHRLPSMRDCSTISIWQPYRLNASMAGICGSY